MDPVPKEARKLIQSTTDTLKSLEYLSMVLAERIKVEENYLSGLNKVHGQLNFVKEGDPLAFECSALRVDVSQRANHTHYMVDQMKGELEDITNILKQNTNSIKDAETYFRDSDKNLRGKWQGLDKMKDKLASQSKEVEELCLFYNLVDGEVTTDLQKQKDKKNQIFTKLQASLAVKQQMEEAYKKELEEAENGTKEQNQQLMDKYENTANQLNELKRDTNDICRKQLVFEVNQIRNIQYDLNEVIKQIDKREDNTFKSEQLTVKSNSHKQLTFNTFFTKYIQDILEKFNQEKKQIEEQQAILSGEKSILGDIQSPENSSSPEKFKKQQQQSEEFENVITLEQKMQIQTYFQSSILQNKNDLHLIKDNSIRQICHYLVASILRAEGDCVDLDSFNTDISLYLTELQKRGNESKISQQKKSKEQIEKNNNGKLIEQKVSLLNKLKSELQELTREDTETPQDQYQKLTKQVDEGDKQKLIVTNNEEEEEKTSEEVTEEVIVGKEQQKLNSEVEKAEVISKVKQENLKNKDKFISEIPIVKVSEQLSKDNNQIEEESKESEQKDTKNNEQQLASTQNEKGANQKGEQKEGQLLEKVSDVQIKEDKVEPIQLKSDTSTNLQPEIENKESKVENVSKSNSDTKKEEEKKENEISVPLQKQDKDQSDAVPLTEEEIEINNETAPFCISFDQIECQCIFLMFLENFRQTGKSEVNARQCNQLLGECYRYMNVLEDIRDVYQVMKFMPLSLAIFKNTSTDKLYIQERVKHHSIWTHSDLWESMIFRQVRDELLKLDVSVQQEECVYRNTVQANICSITLNMLKFRQTKQQTKNIAAKLAYGYGIPQQLVNDIIQFIENIGQNEKPLTFVKSNQYQIGLKPNLAKGRVITFGSQYNQPSSQLNATNNLNASQLQQTMSSYPSNVTQSDIKANQTSARFQSAIISTPSSLNSSNITASYTSSTTAHSSSYQVQQSPIQQNQLPSQLQQNVLEQVQPLNLSNPSTSPTLKDSPSRSSSESQPFSFPISLDDSPPHQPVQQPKQQSQPQRPSSEFTGQLLQKQPSLSTQNSLPNQQQFSSQPSHTNPQQIVYKSKAPGVFVVKQPIIHQTQQPQTQQQQIPQQVQQQASQQPIAQQQQLQKPAPVQLRESLVIHTDSTSISAKQQIDNSSLSQNQPSIAQPPQQQQSQSTHQAQGNQEIDPLIKPTGKFNKQLFGIKGNTNYALNIKK